MAAKTEVNRSRLLDLMDETLNDSELRDIVLALNVDYDNLAGTNKRDRIRELIDLCRRTQRLPELLDLCRRARPRADWQNLHQDIARPPAVTPAPPRQGNTITIGGNVQTGGDFVAGDKTTASDD